MIGVYEAVAKFFGLTSRFDPHKDSRGAAVRQTKVSSVEGFASDVFAKSLQGIFGNPKNRSPEEVNLGILDAINEGKAVVAAIQKDVNSLLNWFTNKREQAAGVAGGAASSFGGIFGAAGTLAKLAVR